MPKLSKKQLREVRRQAKEAREKAQQEEGCESEVEEVKKDYMGLSREDRESIREIKSGLDKPGPKISWNYENGELVYLPDSSIGMIVQTNAKDLPVSYFETDMKKTLSRNKYEGKVFVVTTSGNHWYYPKQLRKVRD